MKSIVEEASTIEKAITQAWTRADKPQKFTITVFQEPEKNFFGMTTAPAKIGFMFEERAVQHKSQKRTSPRKQQHTSQQQPKRYEQPRDLEPTQNKQPHEPNATYKQKINEPSNSNRFWTQEMVDSANKWLTNTLKITNKEPISFLAKPNRYHLKIQFSEPLYDDAKKEKAVFRSFAHLIMQAQRSAFKKAFKHHKVILMSR